MKCRNWCSATASSARALRRRRPAASLFGCVHWSMGNIQDLGFSAAVAAGLPNYVMFQPWKLPMDAGKIRRQPSVTSLLTKANGSRMSSSAG